MEVTTNPRRGSDPPPVPDHHGNHDGLLRPLVRGVVGFAPVDAIVVVTARPPQELRRAIDLAAHHGCTLIALCSHLASAEEAAVLARARGVDIVAVDNPTDRFLPAFETTSLLHGTEFEYTPDTSVKRNFALLLANIVGWRRLVFLDDDIAVPDPDDLRRAASLLDRFEAVGLPIGFYPDNSVVCHANRESNGPQRTFISVGALAVDPAVLAFFPRIYNEDWFFLLDPEGLRSATSVGRARQKPYDPYDHPRRARREEFGDTLGEGVFWMLDKRGEDHDAGGPSWAFAQDEPYWAFAQEVRLRLIDQVGRRLDATIESAEKRARMRTSLAAARQVNERIEPSLFVRYVKAWLRDRELWRAHVDDQRKQFTNRSGWADLSAVEKLAAVLAEWRVDAARASGR